MKNLLFLLLILFYLCSCTNLKTSNNRSFNRSADSTEIVKLLHNVYKWHGTRGYDTADFEIIVKGSFQVGIDTVKFKNTLREIKATNYFAADFLKNYERVARETDNKLKHGKYYNEINFPFQDSDPWTFFQDDAGNYWDSLKISDLRISVDTASLKWKLGGKYPTDDYLVKFKRENNIWRVAYLQGFDIHSVNLISLVRPAEFPTVLLLMRKEDLILFTLIRVS